MTPRTRWFVLLGPAVVAGMALTASAQAKGAPAGEKHPGPGMHAGPGAPPPMLGRGPGMKDKDKAKGNDADAKGPKAKHDGKNGDEGNGNDPKGKHEGKPDEGNGNDPKGKHEGKGEGKPDEGKPEGNAQMPPPPPDAPDETLRHPPDHRAGHGPAPNAELRQKWQQRRADQMKRRRAALQQMREEWGEGELLKPEVKAAIKVHAWRMARLRRIRELALQDPDGKDLVEKVDKLTEKEEERFRLQMARIKRGSDVGTVGDASAPGPGSPPGKAADKPPPPTAGKKEGAAPAGKPSTAGKKDGAK